MRTVIGLERIAEYHELFAGKKIGLITNFTGILPDLSKDTMDVFWDGGYQIERIFTPEHGLYGAGAGEKVEDCVHPRYGIPVISLYGEHKKPTDNDVEGLELLVYDIQDVGLRYYTYIYTMCYALDTALMRGIPFVILDRPNPLGGNLITGSRMEACCHSFVGDYELPMRYGLTVGEMAQYYLKYTGKKAEVKVIPLQNYARNMMFPQTGLLWNVPSPSLPTYEGTLCYVGGGLFEATNISEGRGSSRPFQMYGAPFIDMDLLYRDVKEEWSENSVVFRKRSFVPGFSKHQGQICFGLEFFPVEEACDFLPLALILMKAIVRRYPEQTVFHHLKEDGPHDRLKVLSGNDLAEQFVHEEITMRQLKEAWHADAEKFREYCRDILIYHEGEGM